MRLAGTKLAANHQYRGFGDQLYDLSGQRPSLDLNFANTKSLVDATTGQNLVTFTRASSGTYVDSQGVIRTATTNLLLRSEEFDNASWTKASSVSVSANTVIAPNGTLTADTVTADSGLGIFQTITSVIGVNYSNSIYVKAGTATSIMFRDDTGAGRHIVFNPSTGVITSTAGTLVSFGSQAVGDGWYRYWMVYAADATSVRGIVRPNSAGSAQTFVVWGAQLEQSSTVGEYIPTTSTINSAPRFDHNPTTGESLGLLVEEQRTNSIRNNTMVGAVAGTPGTLPTNWQQFGSTGGITRNIVGIGVENEIPYIDLRYFGTSTNTTSLSLFLESLTSAPAATNQTWTSSAYFRLMSGSIPTFIQLYVYGFSSAPGQVNQFGLTFAPTSAPLVSQRINVTGTLTAATVAFASAGIFVPAPAVGTNVDFTLRIGMPQLEQGAFPTSVIPTTTAAVTRSADVASITGSNFGTFRTNLLLQSEDFSATWANTESTEAINVETAPNGTLTADKLIPDVGVTSGQFRQDVSKAATSTTYTCSVYGKAAEFNRLSIRVEHNGSTGNRADVGFSLSDGSVVSAATAIGTFSGASSTATFIGAGWYRFTLSFTSSTETSLRIRLFGFDSSLPCNGTSGIYLWGAQLETGSTATAYIPTTTAAVTVVESPWYRQDEGTVFAEWIKNGSANFQATAALSDGTSNNLIALTHGSGAPTNNARFDVNSAGVSQASLVLVVGSAVGVSYRTVGTYKVNDFAASVNGASAIGDTSGSVPSISQLTVGANSGAGFLNGTIRRLTYFPARLANETLQRITQ